MYDTETQYLYPDLEQTCSILMNNLKLQKEKDWQMKEKSEYDYFSEHFDEIVKYIMIPSLLDKFQNIGYEFQEVCKSCNIQNENFNIHVDIVFQNYDAAMLIDTKINLSIDNINDHEKCLENMRKYDDLRGYTHRKRRTFLGAVAGVVIPKNVRENALKQGFYLIEPSGESFNITSPYGKPKEW